MVRTLHSPSSHQPALTPPRANAKSPRANPPGPEKYPLPPPTSTRTPPRVADRTTPPARTPRHQLPLRLLQPRNGRDGQDGPQNRAGPIELQELRAALPERYQRCVCPAGSRRAARTAADSRGNQLCRRRWMSTPIGSMRAIWWPMGMPSRGGAGEGRGEVGMVVEARGRE